jgi:hypothetical protein
MDLTQFPGHWAETAQRPSSLGASNLRGQATQYHVAQSTWSTTCGGGQWMHVHHAQTAHAKRSDVRLAPDLLRGRLRLIGRDLDIGKEGSEQTIVTLQLLHHDSVGYQHART